MIQLFTIIIAGYILLGYSLKVNSLYRLQRGALVSGYTVISQISGLMAEYSKENSRMPNSNSWYDSLQKVNNKSYPFSAHIPSILNVECNFAFNKNLSNAALKDLAGNTVLFFEADGENNLSGGPELVDKKRAVDGFFLFKKQRVIYVLYVDGTIAKYRLYDGAVAFYNNREGVTDISNENYKNFTCYFKKGETPYSPLKWN